MARPIRYRIKSNIEPGIESPRFNASAHEHSKWSRMGQSFPRLVSKAWISSHVANISAGAHMSKSASSIWINRAMLTGNRYLQSMVCMPFNRIFNSASRISTTRASVDASKQYLA